MSRASISTYMELPPYEKNGELPYVIQEHRRGNSSHLDLRMRVNGHLIGWTILTPGRAGEEIEFKPEPGMGGKKLRAERKAKQPVEWLEVEGEVKPGEVGATAHESGLFRIIDSGKVFFGTQKPYFHEYFLDGKLFKRIRVVVRGVKLKRLDPETKEPLKDKWDLTWTIWVPEDQSPYAVSKRAKDEGWYPPKGFIPIPDYWIKEHEDEYEEWLERAKQHWSGKAVHKAEAEFALSEHKWVRLGRSGRPVGSRQIPQREWYLFLLISGSSPRVWQLSENPLWATPAAAQYVGKVSAKYMVYEGELEPMEAFNPNKSLKSKLTILASGVANLNVNRVNNKEVISFTARSGPMRGSWVLAQEEEGSDIYTLDRGKLAKFMVDFVLHEHKWEGGKHYDIRLDRGKYLDEITMQNNPLEFKGDQDAKRKICEDPSWMSFEGKRKVDGVETEVRILDKGEADIIHETEDFMSVRFYGKELTGIWHVLESADGRLMFGSSALPPVRKAIKIIEKPTSIVAELSPIEDFTSCEPQDRVKLYDAPEPPDGARLRICVFPRPGAIHGARIQSIIFPKPQYSVADIRGLDLGEYTEWESDQVRGK